MTMMGFLKCPRSPTTEPRCHSDQVDPLVQGGCVGLQCHSLFTSVSSCYVCAVYWISQLSDYACQSQSTTKYTNTTKKKAQRTMYNIDWN